MTKVPVIVSFGEILFDVIEGNPHLGGAPLNLAVQLKRQGADASIISSVGRDPLGDTVFSALEQYGMDTAYVHRSDYPTGSVTVTLDDAKVPCYKFLNDCAYDHIETDYSGNPDLFCYGTLSQRSEVSRSTLHRLWDSLQTRFFYDVNLRQDFYSKERIRESLLHADIVKINDEEFRVLCQLFDLPSEPSAMTDRFGLDVLILTMGPDGCRVSSKGRTVHSPAVPVKVVSTVGSGDAFSAAFLYHYLKGEDLPVCADAGNALAAKVAGQAGAI